MLPIFSFQSLISPPPLLTVDHDDAGDSLVLLQPLQSLVQLGPARLRGGTVRGGMMTDTGGLVWRAKTYINAFIRLKCKKSIIFMFK